MKGTRCKPFKHNGLRNKISAFRLPGGEGLRKSLFRSGTGGAIPRTARSRRLVLFWDILLGSLFIALGAVIGLIETTSLEKHPRTAGDYTHSLGLPAFGTFLDGFFGHGLVFLEPVLARPAFIFISRHTLLLLFLRYLTRQKD